MFLIWISGNENPNPGRAEKWNWGWGKKAKNWILDGKKAKKWILGWEKGKIGIPDVIKTQKVKFKEGKGENTNQDGMKGTNGI